MNDKDSAKLREEIEKILQETIQFTHNGSGSHIKIDATLAAQAIVAHTAAQVAAARIDTIAQIFGVKTEGIIDDGDLFIKRRPLEDKIVELIGYEAFKAIQESIDAAQLHKEQPEGSK